MYNRTMELVEKLEAEGRIYVIRPMVPTVSRLEQICILLLHQSITMLIKAHQLIIITLQSGDNIWVNRYI